MGVHRRPDSNHYVIEVRWRGYPRIKLSTGTSSKTRARQIESTLGRLREAGRKDIIELLVSGKLNVADVHNQYVRDPQVLEQLLTRQETPALGPLVEEWVAWLRDPGTLSPRTRRPYAVGSIARYVDSWKLIFERLPSGRDTQLGELTRGCMLAYRTMRRRAGCDGSTVNRDLTAVQSLLRWAEEERHLTIPRFRMPKEREPEGRERWLDANEIAALKAVTPDGWWPLFALLIYTGLRVGEAQGLRWADVRLVERRIRVHERDGRRLKTASSQRDVPIAAPLVAVLTEHAKRVPHGPNDQVFAGDRWRYSMVRHTLRSAVGAAKLPHVAIHDLRHTFGVHCAQAGVPLPRLQKLMGHASPIMTMRYMKHAPESYFAEDAARLAASIEGVASGGGETSPEGGARGVLRLA